VKLSLGAWLGKKLKQQRKKKRDAPLVGRHIHWGPRWESVEVPRVGICLYCEKKVAWALKKNWAARLQAVYLLWLGATSEEKRILPPLLKKRGGGPTVTIEKKRHDFERWGLRKEIQEFQKFIHRVLTSEGYIWGTNKGTSLKKGGQGF